jgi:hypothetical protein
MVSVGSLPPLVDLSNSLCATLCRRITYQDTPMHVALPAVTTTRDGHATDGMSSSLALDIQHQENLFKELYQRKCDSNADVAHRAESLVDAFLATNYTFHPDAIPWDYLDTPPANLAVVQSNLNTLLHVTAEVFLPSSLVAKDLIIPFVAQSWEETLTPLRHSMMHQREALLGLAQQALRLSATPHSSHSSPICASTPSAFSLEQRCQKLISELDKDLWYLGRIYNLEEFHSGPSSRANSHYHQPQQQHEQRTRDAMSDFVTMSGVVIGRLHRLENEHRTVVDHWAKTRV